MVSYEKRDSYPQKEHISVLFQSVTRGRHPFDTSTSGRLKLCILVLKQKQSHF